MYKVKKGCYQITKRDGLIKGILKCKKKTLTIETGYILDALSQFFKENEIEVDEIGIQLGNSYTLFFDFQLKEAFLMDNFGNDTYLDATQLVEL